MGACTASQGVVAKDLGVKNKLDIEAADSPDSLQPYKLHKAVLTPEAS